MNLKSLSGPGLLFFLISVFAWSTHIYPGVLPEKALNQVYYGMVESIVADSTIQPSPQLKGFIRDHPWYERAYLRLIEYYILADSLTEANAFLEELAITEPTSRPHISRALAKVYSLEQDAAAALEAFTIALSGSPVSPDAIIDFISFARKSQQDLNLNEFLETTLVSVRDRKLGMALLKYVGLDFEGAIAGFRQLAKTGELDLAVFFCWGNSHYLAKQYEKADSVWNAGLDFALEDGDLEMQAKLWMHLALLPAYYEKETGGEFLELSYNVASRIGDRNRLMYLAGNRGIFYRRQGDHKRAEAFFVEAIEISKQLKSDRNLALWFANYGQLLHDMNRLDDALRYYDLAEKHAKISKYKFIEIRSSIDKGDLYRSIGQYDLAQKAYAKAYDLASLKSLSTYRMRSRIGQADIYFAKKEYKKAEAIYSDYLMASEGHEDTEINRSYVYLRRGRSYLAMGRLDLAAADFAIARHQGPARDLIWNSIYLAETETHTGHLQQALQLLQTSLDTAVANKNESTLPAVYLGLGRTYKKLHDLEKAIFYYRQAGQIVESTRYQLKNSIFRTEYFVEASLVYQELINCYHQLYQQKLESAYLDSIYYFIEMTKGRTLRDLLRQRRLAKESRKHPAYDDYRQSRSELRQKQRVLRLNYDELVERSQLDSMLAEIEMARTSVVSNRLRLTEEVAGAREKDLAPYSLTELSARLDDRDMGLLLYHITDENAFAFVVANQKVNIVPLQVNQAGLTQEINALISPFHEITRSSLNQIPFKASIAYKLYKSLILPVEERVRLPEHLMIVSDASLTNLPFEMLLVNAPAQATYTPTDKPTYAAGFLQHRYSIVYHTTTTLLDSPRKVVFGEPAVLALANPFEDVPMLRGGDSANRDISPEVDEVRATRRRDIGFRTGYRVDPLPFSQVEAAAIKALRPSTLIYSQSEATRASLYVNLDKYDILHIATHSLIDPLHDLFCGLLLAPSPDDSTDDGILMGYEIAELNLPYDLVALSACGTGRGKLVAAEGVLGLPRLFLSAGAESVMMSLWNIEDNFTSELIPDFYAFYLNDNLPKAAALAKAKRRVLSADSAAFGLHHQHPLFWAAFTIVGDPGTSKIVITFWRQLAILGSLVLAILGAVFLFRTRSSNAKQKLL